jgi:hypothetical protein
MMLFGTVGHSARADDSTPPDARDKGSCTRSAFQVLIDVGHTATSPGADRARGVPEYEFNLNSLGEKRKDAICAKLSFAVSGRFGY